MLGRLHAGRAARRSYASLLMRTENPTLFLHVQLASSEAHHVLGRHSTGGAARHTQASLKVRAELSTLFLHSKLGIAMKRGRCLHVFMLAVQHVARRPRC